MHQLFHQLTTGNASNDYLKHGKKLQHRVLAAADLYLGRCDWIKEWGGGSKYLPQADTQHSTNTCSGQIPNKMLGVEELLVIFITQKIDNRCSVSWKKIKAHKHCAVFSVSGKL